MIRGYRDRRAFRALSLVLKLNPIWATFIIGIVYMPFMILGGFTVALIGFVLALAGVMWIASVPRERRTDDGIWYEMDSDERAEWVYENKRFPKL
jgi:hypothetical protein